MIAGCTMVAGSSRQPMKALKNLKKSGVSFFQTLNTMVGTDFRLLIQKSGRLDTQKPKGARASSDP